MLVDDIRAHLSSANKVTRLGAILSINLQLMRNPSRADSLFAYLEAHIEAESDHDVLSYLHSVIADWKALQSPVVEQVFAEKNEPEQVNQLNDDQGPGYTNNKLIALLSYAHRDNEFHGGFITTVGESIKDAVNLYLGTDGYFDVVYDAKDIKLGEQWQRKLDIILERTNFLIPILSPNYILSKYCLYELEKFMSREKIQQRDDLIFPIKFIKLDNVDTSSSSIVANLLNRQYVNWTDLRFEQISSRPVAEAIDSLALQIVDAIARGRQVEFAGSLVPAGAGLS